jgi:hypothetical protein
MITKILYAYTVNYLRQEKSLRDHDGQLANAASLTPAWPL